MGGLSNNKMKFKIPDNFMRKPIAGARERVLAASKIGQEDRKDGEIGTYEIPESEQRNYIQVPQFGVAIAMRETYLGKDMYYTLDALLSEKLKMPSQRQFMRHWFNVQESAEGKRRLVYADGSPVSDDVSKDLWGYMSSTDRTPWKGKICWTWLNSLFKEENGEWFVEEDLKVVLNAKKEKSLKGTPIRLDTCIMSDGYADLNFNSQSLPLTQSSVQEYEQGKNIYFWHPRNERVAGFCADSGRALLYCSWVPADFGSSLGVFASAPAGARSDAKNSGGIS